MIKSVRDLEARLACTLKDRSAAAAAQRLRRSLTRFRARYLESRWRLAESAALLAGHCAAKNSRSCKLRQQLLDLSTLELARHSSPCRERKLSPDYLGTRGSVMVGVTASGGVKTVKRASTIGVAVPLLLAADRRAIFGATIRAVSGSKIPMRALVASSAKHIDTYYAWLPETDYLEPSLPRPLIVLDVVSKTTRVRGPKRLRAKLAGKGCTRGGQSLAAVLECIDQQLEEARPRYVLIASAKARWAQVVPVLAQAAVCHKGYRRRIRLLPAPRSLKRPGVVLTTISWSPPEPTK